MPHEIAAGVCDDMPGCFDRRGELISGQGNTFVWSLSFAAVVVIALYVFMVLR